MSAPLPPGLPPIPGSAPTPQIPQPVAPVAVQMPVPTVPVHSSDATYRVTADELRQFVERWERLEAEKQDIMEQQKEVMAEAKARGYDTKVMRLVIARRKRDRDDIAEEEAILDMYQEALGM